MKGSTVTAVQTQEIAKPEQHDPEIWTVYQDEDGGDLWVLDSEVVWQMIGVNGEVVSHEEETWSSIVLNYGPIRIVKDIYSDEEIHELSAYDYS